MAAILTRPNRLGNWLKKEFWTEDHWCRKTIRLAFADMTDTELQSGAVVTRAAASTTIADEYTRTAQDTVATPATDQFAVVINEDLTELKAAAVAAGQTYVVADALVGGPSVVRLGGLLAGNGFSTANAIEGLARQGVKVESRSSVLNNA